YLTLTSGTVDFSDKSTDQVFKWQSGTMHSNTIPLSPPINPAQAISIKVDLGRFDNQSFSIMFYKIEVTGHIAGTSNSIELYSSSTNTTISKANSEWIAW